MVTAEWRREDLRRIAELIRDIDICMFVTRSNGTLRGRPMSNNGRVEFDGDSWFFSERETPKVEEIEADPRVELAYMATDRGAWISIEGTAEIVDDERRKRDLWEDSLEAWFEGGPDDDGIVLLKVRADRVHAWADGEELVGRPGAPLTRIGGEEQAEGRAAAAR
jgi:general stress protein 26